MPARDLKAPKKHWRDDILNIDETVARIIADWTDAKLTGPKFTAEIAAALLTEEVQHDPRLAEWIADHTKTTKAEWTKLAASTIRREKIIAEYGRIPKDATDLVRLYVERDRIECLYDGTINRDPVKYMDVNGEKLMVTASDLENPTVKLWANVMHGGEITTIDMERDLRISVSKLKLNYSRDEIADAVYDWHATAKRERLLKLIGTVGDGKVSGFEATHDEWRELVTRCFDTSETSVDFVVAALMKFMHQVKNKMLNEPVFDHLMLVILGPQGTGKSTFVKAMFSPLAELSVETNFRQIEDDRNIDLWDHYILFLDEMGHAARADIEAIKHAITATKLTRRPMRSNSKVSILQKGTFIGCSNKELEQLIKDPTGIRRFLALQFRADADWDYINAMNWTRFWESVDNYAACPMKKFKAELAAIQEETRDLGRVEKWLRNFTSTDIGYDDNVNHRGRITAENLYLTFRNFEDLNFPGHFKTSRSEWDHEMKRLRKNKADCMVFEKVRENSGTCYCYMGFVQGFAPGRTAEVVPLASIAR